MKMFYYYMYTVFW